MLLLYELNVNPAMLVECLTVMHDNGMKNNLFVCCQAVRFLLPGEPLPVVRNYEKYLNIYTVFQKKHPLILLAIS